MPFFRKKSSQQETPVIKPTRPNRKRSERLSLSLTPEEKNLICDGANAAGMCRRDFVIASVKGTRVVVITSLQEVLLELSRQGNSMNQIARRLNQKSCVNYAEIEKTCRACQNAYEAVVRFIDRWDVKLKRMGE